MSLYLTIELCSFIIPLIFSFDRKVGFYKKWGALFISLTITLAFFIIFDITFTKNGIWGFNSHYISATGIAGLPLEEWLFFIIMPYSSIFIHYVIIEVFPGIVLTDLPSRIITAVLLSGLVLIIILNFDKKYTLYCSTVMALALLISLSDRNKVINRYYISFLIIFIPFLVINGILTGSFLNKEVFWYNPVEITGIRIMTIPVEDVAYAFSLVLINLILMGYFQKLIVKKRARSHEPFIQ